MKLEWIEANKELPKEGKVLVMYLEPFFGDYSSEIGLGYYDDPEDYEDNDGKGWLLWQGDVPIKVTHWAKIEETNVVLNTNSQKEFLEKYDCELGTVPSEAIKYIVSKK